MCRRLLARMCLVREEVRWLDQEQNFTSSSTSDGDSSANKQRVSSAYFARANVPQRCIAYLKVSSPFTSISVLRIILLMRILRCMLRVPTFTHIHT